MIVSLARATLRRLGFEPYALTRPCPRCKGSGFDPHARGCGYDDVCCECGGDRELLVRWDWSWTAGGRIEAFRRRPFFLLGQPYKLAEAGVLLLGLVLAVALIPLSPKAAVVGAILAGAGAAAASAALRDTDTE